MIDHVDIRVSDMAASREFYRDILGAPTVDDDDFVEWGDFGIVDGEPPTRRLHIAVVADVDRGRVVDPDGNTVEAVRDETRGPGAIVHVRLLTRDVAAAKRFYDVVAPVVGDSDSMSFAADDEPTQNVHLAFGVPDFETVVRFHEVAVAAGHRDNGGPGERPQYHPGYYGAFVLDPDGHNVEAVFHDRR